VADGASAEKFVVSGRGELHLAVLIETMRREGYEFEVSRPEVILHEDADGMLLEPIEEVHIEVADEMVGVVIDLLGARRGQMIDMRSENSTTYLKYLVPTRGLLGFRTNFLAATNGMGQMTSILHGYEPYTGPIPGRGTGSLVAFEHGVSTTYALNNAQQRGTLFIGPGVEVYEGMVVEEAIRLTPPREMSLDKSIEFLAGDELLEVTPDSLRIRKRTLDNELRLKEQKRLEKMADVQV
jgi:GTP-binding protein